MTVSPPAANQPILLRGAEVIDPSGARAADVLIEGNTITAVDTALDVRSDALVIDVAGCIVSTGFVDLHTHLREPGNEDAETIATGSRGAALGGFTAVLAMPDTTPVVDTASTVREILYLARDASCTVQPVGAITHQRRGERLADMAGMAALGVSVFTDNGRPVVSSAVMRRAMEYARGLGVTLAQHCEDPALAANGVMHEGEWSSRLGLPGQPAVAEELMVQRELALSKLTGARIHLQHLSTARSVELVREAKAARLAVTAEASTHHFTLTHDDCGSFDPVFRVSPPLRPADDAAAIRVGLADGTIDAIATGHAPHTSDSKELPFDQAPPGMLGLETAFALALTELDVPIERLLDMLSWRPAKIAGLARHGRAIAPGEPANLCVIDPAATWTVAGAAMASLSRNTPYEGRSLRGRVRHTIHEGVLVVFEGQAQQ
jgi:dihydroorotase